jgi:protein tyrosine phosphatase (PTP) superfamily phosphohydrolase (DUF442 family)
VLPQRRHAAADPSVRAGRPRFDDSAGRRADQPRWLWKSAAAGLDAEHERPPAARIAASRSDRVLGGPVKATTAEPPVSKPDATATASPSNGLPGFTQIKEGVATGRKPALDGFETLKKDGYKSVVFLYAPGADVAAVRDLAATRGFTFTAIETTPDKLTDAYEQLNKAIAGKTAAQPVYVFDDDGTRAAALWYLHFKSVDLESNDVAKIRAKSLGLADDSEFWPTIKQHMSK